MPKFPEPPAPTVAQLDSLYSRPAPLSGSEQWLAADESKDFLKTYTGPHGLYLAVKVGMVTWKMLDEQEISTPQLTVREPDEPVGIDPLSLLLDESESALDYGYQDESEDEW